MRSWFFNAFVRCPWTRWFECLIGSLCVTAEQVRMCYSFINHCSDSLLEWDRCTNWMCEHSFILIVSFYPIGLYISYRCLTSPNEYSSKIIYRNAPAGAISAQCAMRVHKSCKCFASTTRNHGRATRSFSHHTRCKICGNNLQRNCGGVEFAFYAVRSYVRLLVS